MSNPHRLHCYDYVNQPYEKVGKALATDPIGIFQRATSAAATRAAAIVSRLSVTIAGLEIGKNVVVKVGKVDRSVSVPRLASEATQLELEWTAESGAALFPSMKATLTVYPLSSTETQLDLEGTYEPPGGVLGGAADRLAGHRVAEASVHRFVEDVARYLSAEVW